MIYVLDDKEMQEYENSTAVNQSLLKILGKGLDYYREGLKETDLEMYFEEKEHFLLGKAVDTIVTRGNSYFKRDYFVSELEVKPSATMVSMIRYIFDYIKIHEEEVPVTLDLVPSSLILQACTVHSYQPKWKDETKIEKLIKEGAEYWVELVQSEGKTILSKEEYEVIKEVSNNLKTKTLLTDLYKRCVNHPKIHLYFQYPVYFNHKGEECKGLLDIVLVDEETMTIRPIDIKTTSEYVLNFPSVLRRRRYDFQAAFYTLGLEKNFEHFKILPFLFIVESTKNPGQPLVFELSSRTLLIGKWGCNTLHEIRLPKPEVEVKGNYTTKILGYEQCLDLYIYYKKTGFTQDKRLEDSFGVLNLDYYD
jgi:hypothetical protein